MPAAASSAHSRRSRSTESGWCSTPRTARTRRTPHSATRCATSSRTPMALSPRTVDPRPVGSACSRKTFGRSPLSRSTRARYPSDGEVRHGSTTAPDSRPGTSRRRSAGGSWPPSNRARCSTTGTPSGSRTLRMPRSRASWKLSTASRTSATGAICWGIGTSRARAGTARRARTPALALPVGARWPVMKGRPLGRSGRDRLPDPAPVDQAGSGERPDRERTSCRSSCRSL